MKKKWPIIGYKFFVFISEFLFLSKMSEIIKILIKKFKVVNGSKYFLADVPPPEIIIIAYYLFFQAEKEDINLKSEYFISDYEWITKIKKDSKEDIDEIRVWFKKVWPKFENKSIFKGISEPDF